MRARQRIALIITQYWADDREVCAESREVSGGQSQSLFGQSKSGH